MLSLFKSIMLLILTNFFFVLLWCFVYFLYFFFLFLLLDEASCLRMVHEYYTSTTGQFDFLVFYLNETPARGKFISDVYHHPAMAVLELLRGENSL